MNSRFPAKMLSFVTTLALLNILGAFGDEEPQLGRSGRRVNKLAYDPFYDNFQCARHFLSPGEDPAGGSDGIGSKTCFLPGPSARPDIHTSSFLKPNSSATATTWVGAGATALRAAAGRGAEAGAAATKIPPASTDILQEGGNAAVGNTGGGGAGAAVLELALMDVPGGGGQRVGGSRETSRLGFGEGWGFACGHLWSGHLGYWFQEDEANLDGQKDCAAPMTKESRAGLSLCTAYLFQEPKRRTRIQGDEAPSSSTDTAMPVTRIYPVCELVLGMQGDLDRMRIGYGVDRVADSSLVFACPRQWVGLRPSACLPPPPPPPPPPLDVDAAAMAAAQEKATAPGTPGPSPKALLARWQDPRAPIHAAAVDHTVIFAPASFDYLEHAATWARYHQRKRFPVVVVALDLPTYFSLTTEGIPTVYQLPLSGRPLNPWCVERWKMPSWRLAHHAKATQAMHATELGYHTGVMDMDVYLSDAKEVDWKHLSATCALAHSGTFDFYFGYTSCSESARQMWEDILLSVLYGAWDQTSWGWFGDRFRAGLNNGRLAGELAADLKKKTGSLETVQSIVKAGGVTVAVSGTAAAAAAAAAGAAGTGRETAQEGSGGGGASSLVFHKLPAPFGKLEVVVTGRHEHMPLYAVLPPNNATLRRLQNREEELAELLALDNEDSNAPAPSPSSPALTTTAAADTAAAAGGALTTRRPCRVRWDDASPCFAASSSSSSSWSDLRTCVSFLLAAADALEASLNLDAMLRQEAKRNTTTTTTTTTTLAATNSAAAAAAAAAAESRGGGGGGGGDINRGGGTAFLVSAVLSPESWSGVEAPLLKQWFRIEKGRAAAAAAAAAAATATSSSKTETPTKSPSSSSSFQGGERWPLSEALGFLMGGLPPPLQRLKNKNIKNVKNQEQLCELVVVDGSDSFAAVRHAWKNVETRTNSQDRPQGKTVVRGGGGGASRDGGGGVSSGSGGGGAAALKPFTPELLTGKLSLFLQPRLPGRRIQGHACLPTPFARASTCLAKCENDEHACATWKGDAPLPFEKCPQVGSASSSSTSSWQSMRCDGDSLTPKCKAVTNLRNNF